MVPPYPCHQRSVPVPLQHHPWPSAAAAGPVHATRQVSCHRSQTALAQTRGRPPAQHTCSSATCCRSLSTSSTAPSATAGGAACAAVMPHTRRCPDTPQGTGLGALDRWKGLCACCADRTANWGARSARSCSARRRTRPWGSSRRCKSTLLLIMAHWRVHVLHIWLVGPWVIERALGMGLRRHRGCLQEQASPVSLSALNLRCMTLPLFQEGQLHTRQQPAHTLQVSLAHSHKYNSDSLTHSLAHRRHCTLPSYLPLIPTRTIHPFCSRKERQPLTPQGAVPSSRLAHDGRKARKARPMPAAHPLTAKAQLRG